jgi:hypothetical protein
MNLVMEEEAAANLVREAGVSEAFIHRLRDEFFDFSETLNLPSQSGARIPTRRAANKPQRACERSSSGRSAGLWGSLPPYCIGTARLDARKLVAGLPPVG